MKSAFIAVPTFLLTGCSLFTPPIAKPIIEDHAQNQVNTFAIQPSRRMLIVKNSVNHQRDFPSEKLENGLLPDKAILICAEASPDVSDDILASLAAAASAKGPSAGEAKAAEAGASLAQALATTGQSLFKRSQALQLYRDAAYHLCQAKLNGFLKDEEFNNRLDIALKNAVQLLQLEIPWLYASQAVASVNAGDAKEDVKRNITVDKDGKITIKAVGLDATLEPPKPPRPGADNPPSQ